MMSYARWLIVLLMLLAQGGITAVKAVVITLEDAIRRGQEQSIDAMVAKLNFMSSYWNYRSFRAELLPSVSLASTLMKYDRSLVETRNYENGQISMVENNSLTNSLSLSVDQNIAALGGVLSLQSYVYRLDQFNYDSKLYQTQPLRLRYSQPLFALNELKWDTRSEPLRYEQAKRAYIETMENVNVSVVALFFDVLYTQANLNQSRENLKDRERLFSISNKRFEWGSITKGELLQLELSLLKARIAVKEREVLWMSSRNRFLTYLHIPLGTEIELVAPAGVPDLVLSAQEVAEKALQCSTHQLTQQLSVIQAERAVAQAKANRGIKMNLSGEVGFSKTAPHFGDAYNRLDNNQVVGVTLSFPIFDWGMGSGKVKMAEVDLEATLKKVEQEHNEYVLNLETSVLKFNMQCEQCRIAGRAQEIAEERYEIAKRLFEAGTTTVTELNMAWQEAETARTDYINQLNIYWSNYYALRKATLHDWIKKQDLKVDFESVIRR